MKPMTEKQTEKQTEEIEERWAEVGQKTKKEILEHYALRDPHRFIQIDGFTDMKGDMLDADGDGKVVTVGETYELMSGNVNVRVLINPNTPREDVHTLLGLMQKYFMDAPFDGVTPLPKVRELSSAYTPPQD